MSESTERLSSALADRYKILHRLGEGGMATVYLAEDLKHKRQVALKVLKPDLAAVLGAERFIQEITTTASLQHPHILPLFDSGEADSFLYYVMPYIEGETLRSKLDREHQVGIDEAVRIAGDVGDALDYAHRHDIIHRDIKPENILLHDGRPMVADFGIALAVSAAAGGRMTETGLSLGTPHYMSPEQATAEKDLSARSDVYSLASVLYEMLAGDPPHTGSSAQQIIMKIVTEDVAPVTNMRKSVPPNVTDATAKALEKLPADRFETAAEFAAALADSNFRVAGASAAAVAQSEQQAWKRRAFVGAATSAVLLGLALWAWLRSPSSAAVVAPSHLAIIAPGVGGSRGNADWRFLTLTPDGGRVIYSALRPDGTIGLMRQALDATTPSDITLEGDWQLPNTPLVSPDGRWLLVSTLANQTFRFPIDGGIGIHLDLGFIVGPFSAWDSDGNLWVTPNPFENVLLRIGAQDTMRLVVEGVDVVRMQQILPDGRHALALIGGVGSLTGPAAIIDLEAGTATALLSTAISQVRYTQGHLVYVLGDGTLMAAPFDHGRREVAGTPVAVATGVSIGGTGVAQFAVADNGTVAYIPVEPRTLVLVDRAGGIRQATPERRNFHAPMFAPDGRRLAVDFNTSDGRDIWVLDLQDGTLSRATFDRDGHDPTWTPDGQFITYASDKAGALGIYRSRPGTAELAESLLVTPRLSYTGTWLRDGTAMVTVGNQMLPGSMSDIGIVRNEGRGPLEPLLASQFNEEYATVSRDGQWLAFASDQSGRRQVYVRLLDGSGGLVQVSQAGGSEPVWSPEGSQLFYRGTSEGRTMLMAAIIETSPDLAVTDRRSLFPVGEFVSSVIHANYDVSPDGRQFAMIRHSPGARIMVIQNLAALVERRSGQVAGTQ